MMRERRMLEQATEQLLAAIGGADPDGLEVALRERERAFAALRSAAGSAPLLGSDETSQRVRDLERELLAAAVQARAAVAGELREVQALRRSARRLRGPTEARFFESRV